MQRHFIRIFVGVILIKLLLAYFAPITSDEAYFYIWGDRLDLNYYDHPPMTGWFIYLFGLLGHHIFFLRLASILSGIVVALGLFLGIGHYWKDPEKGRLVSLLFLVSPLHVLFVLMLTDTPLMIFAFLSGVLFFDGVKRENKLSFLLSGLCWSGAVLSKYFAGLLLPAFVICFLVAVKPRAWVKNGLVWIGGALPLVMLHLYWNYTNCWTNILFNVFNRSRQVDLSIAGVVNFVLFQAYLATPWLAFYFFRHRQAVRSGLKNDSPVFFLLFTVPLLILGLVSLHHTGLHWSITFYPFLLFLTVYFTEAGLQKLIRYTMVFSAIHVIPIAIVLSLPVETFRGAPYYHDLVLCIHGDEIYDKLADKYGTQRVMGTNGYYTSGAMAYKSGRNFVVFHDKSNHGRYYDKLVDFKQLDGKPFLILTTLPLEEDYRPYFSKLTTDTITVRGYSFYVFLGEQFNYPAYRDLFLRGILESWYTPPDYFPPGDCYFKDNYFPVKRVNED